MHPRETVTASRASSLQAHRLDYPRALRCMRQARLFVDCDRYIRDTSAESFSGERCTAELIEFFPQGRQGSVYHTCSTKWLWMI